MVNRIEASVNPIPGIIKWKNMHAAKQPGQWSSEQAVEGAYAASAQAIRIGNELDLILQR
jgi:hypothetical protein